MDSEPNEFCELLQHLMKERNYLQVIATVDDRLREGPAAADLYIFRARANL